MATSLTAEELELCKKAFQQFDRDGGRALMNACDIVARDEDHSLGCAPQKHGAS